ncbi:C2 family cysteine protease, partial [Planktothrix sp.]
IDDSWVEGSETATINLSSSSAYNLGTTASGTVTIADNDVAAINIGINQTLSGSLSTTDPTNPTRTGGYYKDDYRLTGVIAGQPIKVNLNSSAFDAYVQIINEATGAVVTYNDDANGTNNSEVTFTPQSGVNYLVRVTSYSTNTTGSYSVSTSSSSSGDWFTQNIRDLGLQSIARSRAADNVLDRNDMIAILRDAKDSSVIDGTELTDLRTLVSNATRFSMSDSVRVLSNKVVNSNPANQSYQGSVLGNLFAGSSATQMDNLINKWFLGQDRPSTSYPYQYATGSLFVNGATYQDINQGNLGDCYYLASLATTAFRSPSTIQNMFIDNGDNTYTVRFYNNGVTDYVTVDRYLPTSSGTPIYAETPNGELWVALAEKAYAQLNESGWIGQSNTNSYPGIEGGLGYYAIPHVTGRFTSQVYNPSGIVDTNAIINAFNVGSLITVGSKPSGVASNVVPSHEYTLVGYNSSTQQFTLYNPWGTNGGYYNGTFKPGQLQLTASQLSQNFDYWAYTTNNGLPQYGSSNTLPPEKFS